MNIDLSQISPRLWKLLFWAFLILIIATSASAVIVLGEQLHDLACPTHGRLFQ